MMKILREEQLLLFAETKKHNPAIDLPSTLICDDKIIMDDILPYSDHSPTLLHYFSCIAQVFTKDRLSFKLSKCLELISLDTTLQFHGIVPHSPSSNLSNSDLFQKQAPHSFPLSVSVPFTTATVRGLKLISNHSVESNVPITTLPSHLWRGRQHLSAYSSNVKLILLHHPFFFALIGPNQSS